MISWHNAGALEKKENTHIWTSMMKLKHWLLGNLRWEVGLGTKVEIGLASIKGMAITNDENIFGYYK